MDGAQIREARERARLTQKELATLVGVDIRTVGNWERGASSPRSHGARLREILGAHLQRAEELGTPGERSTASAWTESDGDGAIETFIGSSVEPVLGGVSRLEVRYSPGPDREIRSISMLEIAVEAHRHAIDATTFREESDGFGNAAPTSDLVVEGNMGELVDGHEPVTESPASGRRGREGDKPPSRAGQL